ncbi:hypothetical protein GCM10023189_12590 [Nibrella saemangeumensis]|uniref:histidine kinase n=1 Tax=Nibrella saemangeumensis TaxID=1084526 RepID=A0ABP8MLU2_9BACT
MQGTIAPIDILKGVLDSSLNGVAVYQSIRNESGDIIDFQVVLMNAIVEQDLGTSAEAFLGHRLSEFPLDDAQTNLVNQYKKVIETGQPYRTELQYPLPTRSQPAWLDISVVKLEDSVVVSYNDITGIKEAEMSRQQQAELLQRVTDTSLSALACCEAIRDGNGNLTDMKITLVNQMTAQWLNKPVDQILNQTILSLFPVLQDKDAFARLEELIAKGHPYGVEYCIGNRWYSLALAKFGDGIVVSASDITTLRRYQQDLEHSNKELTRSNSDLQQFAYVASHDLQEPLRKIQSFGEMLENQVSGQVSDGHLNLLRRMQDAAQRMQILIQDLLTYSRVSSKKDSFQLISLQTIVQEVLTDLEVTIQDKKAEIKTDALPTVQGDRLQLRQLFQNLISNALKFNQPDIQPVVRIECRQIRGQTIPDASPSELDREFYEISVIDNGIGFDEKYLDRIFQVFQRLHNRSEYSGTGIGLAICKKVVDNHKGHITASSQPDEGATFRVYLPV